MIDSNADFIVETINVEYRDSSESDCDNTPDFHAKKKRRKRYADNCSTSKRTIAQRIPAALDGTYFSVDMDENEVINVNTPIKAKCVTCNSYINGSFHSTSNFHKHMKRKHAEMCEKFSHHCSIFKKTIGVNKSIRSILKSPASSPNFPTSNPNFPASNSIFPPSNPKSSASNTKSQTTSNKFFQREAQKIKQEKLEKSVLRYIVKDMKPLSTIESDNFRAMFTDIDPSLQLISRRTAGRRLDKEMELVKQKLISIVESTDYVCTTADIWSTKHRSFLVVTIHWIDSENLERKNAILACRRLKEAHSYDKIAELLTDIFHEFHIKLHQHLGTITGNTSNFKQTFQEFGIQTSSLISSDDWSLKDKDANHEDDENIEIIEQEVWFDVKLQDLHEVLTQGAMRINDDNIQSDEKILPQHFRCMAQSLNLFATVDFQKCVEENVKCKKLHDLVMKKCNLLWTGANGPKTSRQFKQITNCILTTPNVTQWNSLYFSMVCLLKNKKHLNTLMKVRLPLKNVVFSEAEIDYISEFVEVMKPIAIGLDRLQSNSFYGHAFPVLFIIQSKLTELEKQPLMYLNQLVTNLIQFFNERFSGQLSIDLEFENEILAACFHPAFKKHWVPEEKIEFVEMLCANTLQKFEIENGYDDTSCTTIDDVDDDETYFRIEKPSMKLDESSMKEKSKINYEFTTFLHEAYRSKTMTLNEFFQPFPNVRKLFIKYNTLLSSSAPVEQLFSNSKGKLISTPNHSWLSDHSFEKSIFLKGNAEYSGLLK